MHSRTRTPLACLFALLTCVACGAAAPDRTTATDRDTAWGSDEASVVTVGNKTAIQVLAAGGCYGAYGAIDQVITPGAFKLPGTYTQLMGAYPGHVEYAAEYSIAVAN